MNRYSGVFLALIFCLQLQAQQHTVTGSVADSTTRLPLEAATITLLTDHQPAPVVRSEKNGSFRMQVPSGGPSTLIVSFTGYRPRTIVLPSPSAAGDIGTVYLQNDATSLEAIVVQGKKPPVSFRVDRQVYNAAQFGNAASGTGIDVIRNLPSVSVNALGEISFRGSSSFLVLINGKPTQGDPATMLGQLPAAAIENVETITSPSAAYDADGKAGIINIITKTGIEDGWMLQSSVLYGLPPVKDFDNAHTPQRFGADITAGYRKNKWDISGGLNYLRNDIAGYREGDVYTIRNGIKTAFPSNGERSFKRYNYGGRLAASYQTNVNNLVSAGFYIGKKFQLREADLLYNNYRQDIQTGTVFAPFTYYNANTQEKEGLFSLASLDYTHRFSKNSSLAVSALYEHAGLSGNTYNRNLYYPNTSDTLQFTHNPNTNPLNAIRLKADYTQKLGQQHTLQTGYQYRYDVQDGNFLYYTKIPGTPDYVTDPEFTSHVKTNNRIHAGYVQANGQVHKLNYNLGGRLEYSERDLMFSKNEKKQRLLLNNFFPAAQFRYALTEQAAIKLGYNRRIKRTNNYELNPFPEREHSETLEQGDPNLLPELIGTYELGWEQKLAGGSFFLTFYHQRTKNPIQRVNKVYNDSILNRVFTNAGNAFQTGIETNLSIAVTPWWQCVLGGNVYRYKISGSIFDGTLPVSNNSWVYTINTSQTFTLPANWLLQLSVNYLSERVTAQGEDSRFLTPHFLVKKTTKDKRWYFQLQWLNIDAGMKESNRQRITTYGADFYTTTNYIYEPDQFQLSLGFNLSRRNRKISLPQSEIGEKEF
ncbi:TonB-dependent receptor domain-containing protein [Niabella beijingensis]|uniref:TonB-dependent receptor domain-containing protein n=1 Tax=Niabella beijingensis TaxID=2872700 RepID=UPI001CBEB87D|nr:TonB-dependent receptor [Niabella beijingensis]MBZ4190320.1 TonB-dependent receptor [Niabella beijingensis]